MKAYSHPAPGKVSLEAVLEALADPCRLAIVRHLLKSRRPIACNEVRIKISKATRSHHFEVLRAAGLIHTEKTGAKCLTSLRKAEVNKRFPGLLPLIAHIEKPASGKSAKADP